ncbi:MAG: FAD-dependent oxidoreductase [Bacteroidia bacterium]|nr:FAD-dependent oxidoreductase [Bacteroidia bacterium]
MAHYNPPANEEEFKINFAPFNPPMTDTQAYQESARCLFCHDAPCITACPTAINIPLFIRQIQSNLPTEAGKTIFSSNWLGASCGSVCPTEVLCEGACVYTQQDMPAVQIGRLQEFAARKTIESGTILWKPNPPTHKKVAVIGAGPAGLACALELAYLGHEVTLIEGKDKLSGLLIFGTAPYKITNEAVEAEINWLLKQLPITIKTNTYIKSEEEIQEVLNHNDAVFLGIGLGGTNKLNIPGENIPHVLGAVEMIESLRRYQHHFILEGNVVVIGGGNTAMDAASEASRLGAKRVVLAYRKDKSEMSAYDFEYQHTQNAGVEMIFNVTPVQILGEEQVVGVEFVHQDKSRIIIQCDYVLKANGQRKQIEWLRQINGLTLDDSGKVITNDIMQTGNPKVFAGGDTRNGGKEVVFAVAEGQQAAHGIHQFLLKS